jgi:heme/copper-type cytochrome/quinol oxidase subunit 2
LGAPRNDMIYYLPQGLFIFILALTGAVFVVVFSLFAYAVIRFREKRHDDKREPPQVYGSFQVETAPGGRLCHF